MTEEELLIEMTGDATPKFITPREKLLFNEILRLRNIMEECSVIIEEDQLRDQLEQFDEEFECDLHDINQLSYEDDQLDAD